MPRRLLITPLCAAITITLFLCAPASRLCQFTAIDIAHGQLWRLVTCHFTHWSASHAFWSGGAFVVLGAACEYRSRTATICTILVSSLAISLAVWIGMPRVESYRGLSGVDSALFALLPVLIAREMRSRWTGWIFVGAAYALFLAKVGWEIRGGESLFVKSAEFSLVPMAHLTGFVAGMGIAGAMCIWNRVLQAGAPVSRDARRGASRVGNSRPQRSAARRG